MQHDNRDFDLSRRHFIAGSGVAAVGIGLAAAGIASSGSSAGAVTATKAAAAATDPSTTTVEPLYGAGVYTADPDQTGVSQSASVAVTSDVSSLPLDVDF